MIHNGFRFDYQALHNCLDPVLHAFDSGNHLPLYEATKEACNHIVGNEWVLENLGGSFEPIESFEDFNTKDVGYYVLLILSTFLEPVPSLKFWGILQQSLVHFGWSEEGSWIPVCGFSVASLIKPEEDKRQPPVVKSDDPYWHWVFPLFTYKRGWLDYKEAKNIEVKLIEVREKLHQVDERDTFLLAGQMVNKELMIDSLNESIVMLNSLKKEEEGLFLIIS